MSATPAKKSATPAKSTKKAAAPSHPSYKSMITKAIKDLNEKGGSSKAAIVKYIESHYKVGDKASNQVRLALRASEFLIAIKLIAINCNSIN